MTDYRATNAQKNEKILKNKKNMEAGRYSVAFGLIIVLGVVVGFVIITNLAIRRIGPLSSPPELTDSANLYCPIEEPIHTLTPPTLRSLYILIDRSSSYKASTPWAIATLKKVLPAVLAPGDRVSAAWIGNYSGSPDSTFCCVKPVPLLSAPIFQPSIALPTPQALLTPSENASSMDLIQIDAENARIQAENDVALNAYNCAVNTRNADAEEKLSKWNESSQAEVDAFWKEYESTFAVGKYDNSTQIREALYKAALSVQEDDMRAIRFLLLFTDLEEVGAPSFDGVNPNLNGVQVIIVLRCESAEKCEGLKTEWQDIFRHMGALPPTFLQDAYPEEELIKLLQRRE
jgi:hypothetical protein